MRTKTAYWLDGIPMMFDNPSPADKLRLALLVELGFRAWPYRYTYAH
jgi:hypothetical protein